MMFSGDEDAAWYPKQKVQSARKKLEGFNPAYVMRLVQVITKLVLNLINLTKFNCACCIHSPYTDKEYNSEVGQAFCGRY